MNNQSGQNLPRMQKMRNKGFKTFSNLNLAFVVQFELINLLAIKGFAINCILILRILEVEFIFNKLPTSFTNFSLSSKIDSNVSPVLTDNGIGVVQLRWWSFVAEQNLGSLLVLSSGFSGAENHRNTIF
ncbi:hypothetical protein BpHYR1_023179 [Brachionus plicatilis]|uniref:Uncharacterized protein n=1 Tax=Brachionus plicatilis TaxID=10195 RepID=A0A3M7PMQ3_BRAPC|nr:hypothetical protein BpHYR1_023179 [Brachionus plicatilis]